MMHMTFKMFAQEMWYRYCDECWDCQMEIKPVEKYWADNKWFIKNKYREEVGNLIKEIDILPDPTIDYQYRYDDEYVTPGGDCQV
jgi:phage host-nuclease inhibitor protein Gam